MNSFDLQPEGNYYDKYHSSNPVVKKMMRGFFGNIKELLLKYEVAPEKILEAGCGEGEVTKFLGAIYPEAFIDAFDISDRIISEISRDENEKINYLVGNIYTMTTHAPYSNEKKCLGGGVSIGGMFRGIGALTDSWESVGYA